MRPIRKIRRILRKYRSVIAIAVGVLVLFRCIFLLCYVTSSSMEPTLPVGSLLLASRIYSPAELEDGDIIVFHHDGERLIKRIVACPGETVNWLALDYTNELGLAAEPMRSGRERVPEGYYLVVGDNALNSYDSRFWEEPYISKDEIIAVVLFRH